ncbi:MAG TPA: transglutaminaseTgpA domain-containing protein [Candidatus Dormibacteraeota bacterium]
MRFDWRNAPTLAVRAWRQAWRWLFAGPPRGWGLSWFVICLLALDVGASTATAQWVPGSDALSAAALLGALAGGVLSLVPRLRPLSALALLALLGVFVSGERVGWSSITSGASVLGAGDIAHGGAVLLFLINLLMWVVGAWLAWCVLRWRQPLLALVPGVAIFATNLLNFPAGQDVYLLYFSVLTVTLLLWAGYRRSLEQAARRGLRLTPESRWDFWESGLVAGIGLLVVAFFAPPLSTVDRTVDAQTGLIKAWSDIQIGMHHALPGPTNSSATFSTGFSDQVELGHPLSRSSTVVFTYKSPGGHSTPLYFRGLSVAATVQGEWRYIPELEAPVVLPPNTSPTYAESYTDQKSVTVTIQMLHPPAADRYVYFYPGELQSINRPAVLSQMARSSQVYSVDRLSTLEQTTQGSYKVTGDYSVADETQLRQAGADYPTWVLPYGDPNNWGLASPPLSPALYRSPAVEQEIQALAQQVTKGTSNAYDAATAIELFLRKYTYTLKPPATPPGTDPLAFFLFQSKQGYCEYFASAMGDMLRSLGIPARLVNGFGPGVLDTKSGNYIVRESDAHTWVEVYFPQFGWVPFEPTPDGTYFPIPRGSAACQVEAAACATGAIPAAVGARRAPVEPNPEIGGAAGRNPSRGAFGLPFNPVPWVLGVLALILMVLVVVLVRFLTPRTAGRAWRRTQLLSRLAGIPTLPAETPLEYGRRLARALPAARDAAATLANAFTQAAYGPPELAAIGAEDALAAWQSLRPVLLREAAAKLSGRR